MSCYNSTVPSSSPQNVMVTSVDSASLMVSWQPPEEIDHNGMITGYMINYTRGGTSDMMSVNVNSGTTETISGLVAYVMYSVRVAAVNVNGTGTFSDLMMQLSGQDSEFIKYIVIVIIKFFIYRLKLKNVNFKKGNRDRKCYVPRNQHPNTRVIVVVEFKRIEKVKDQKVWKQEEIVTT